MHSFHQLYAILFHKSVIYWFFRFSFLLINLASLCGQQRGAITWLLKAATLTTNPPPWLHLSTPTTSGNILIRSTESPSCLGMASTSIQDRTTEFRSILGQAQKRLTSNKAGPQRQALLSDAQRKDGGAERRSRSEFARKAAEIGRGITGTTAKLQRLAECTWYLDRNLRPSWS